MPARTQKRGLERRYRFDDVPVLLVPPAARRSARSVTAVLSGTWTARLSRTGAVRIGEVNAVLEVPSLAGIVPPRDPRRQSSVADTSALIPVRKATFRLSKELVGAFGALNQGRIFPKSRLITATLGLQLDISHVAGFPRESARAVLRVTGHQDGPGFLTLAGAGMVLTGAFALTVMCCAGPRPTVPPVEPQPEPIPAPPPPPPTPAPPPADPCTNIPIPDTDTTLANAIGRIGRDEIHSNTRAAYGRQGHWATNQFSLNGVRLPDLFGLTFQFLKLELGVGCTPPSDWKIGIKDVDLQFRIALSPGAQQREAADGGTTPGGFAGVLGHEAEHGEATAYALKGMLDGSYPTSRRFLDLVDGMKARVFRRRADAEAAAEGYRRQMLDILKDQVSRFGSIHNDTAGARPNDTIHPRLNTAEPLDNPAQTTAADQVPLATLKAQMAALRDDGYEFMGTRVDGLPW